MNNAKKVALALVAFLLVFVVWVGATLTASIPKTPELALKRFYEREVAEDQIMDPLILAGKSVVPLLENEVTNPAMPQRRYAIGALGNLRSNSSLPVLKRLVYKKSEEDYIRCDALIAIGMIDHDEGRRVFNSVKADIPHCGAETADEHSYSQWLKSNTPKRTYLEALLGWHS